MKIISQIVTVLGIAISALYLYFKGFDFTGTVTLLSFVAGFAATFYFSKSSKMNQKTGDNSKAFQAGRDINIKD